MADYISEGTRYYRVAKQNCESVSQNSHDAFVVIIFSAMYFESIVNEVIFHDNLMARLYEEQLQKQATKIGLDIDNEREPLSNKMKMIFDRFGVPSFTQDKEYTEVLHLIALRNGLIHLKAIEQGGYGCPNKELGKALNYLKNPMKLIDDPFGKGVSWTDVLMNKEVANWSFEVVRKAIYWLFEKTHDGQLGNLVLSWHCQLTENEKWKNHH